jgi:hypothetical protein
VRVLYVAGTGRSGSTLVAAMLGQLRGAFAAGEVRYLWQRGLSERRPCGCGTPVPDCPVWTDIRTHRLHPLPPAPPATAPPCPDAVPPCPDAVPRTARTPVTVPPVHAAPAALPAGSTDAPVEAPGRDAGPHGPVEAHGPLPAPEALGAPGAPGAPDPLVLHERLRTRLRLRRTPLFLWRRATGRPPVPAHPADDAALAALYHAIAARTGADVVIDSSKLPPYGALVGALPGVEVKVLHLVRDPRAAAFSWRRTRGLDGAADPTPMDRPSPLRAAVLWLVWNLAARLFWRGDAYLRVRYEDLCADPGGVVRRVATFAGLPTGPLPFRAPGVIDLAPTHTVAGNPARHRTGPVAIVADDEWRAGLGRGAYALVTLVTAPALRLFGYRVGRR